MNETLSSFTSLIQLTAWIYAFQGVSHVTDWDSHFTPYNKAMSLFRMWKFWSTMQNVPHKKQRPKQAGNHNMPQTASEEKEPHLYFLSSIIHTHAGRCTTFLRHESHDRWDTLPECSLHSTSINRFEGSRAHNLSMLLKPSSDRC